MIENRSLAQQSQPLVLLPPLPINLVVQALPLAHIHHPDGIALPLQNIPLPDTQMLRRLPDAPAASADDQIPGAVFLVRLHAPDGAVVDLGVLGDVARLAHGQREGDSFPGAVRAQVHAAEGHVFHEFPAQDRGGGEAVVELEAVVQDALCRCGFQVLVED